MARIAQARGAKFIKRGMFVKALDEPSSVILDQAAEDVAAYLKFESSEVYFKASPGERKRALDALMATE